jgi:hypothetical protein
MVLYDIFRLSGKKKETIFGKRAHVRKALNTAYAEMALGGRGFDPLPGTFGNGLQFAGFAGVCIVHFV